MRKALDAFEKEGVQLLAVDPHEFWSAKFLLKEAGFQDESVDFPMLMDPSLTASATYGVAFQMRIHTELSNRPATFIVDKQGVIRYENRSRKFNDRPSPKEIIEVIQSLDK